MKTYRGLQVARIPCPSALKDCNPWHICCSLRKQAFQLRTLPAPPSSDAHVAPAVYAVRRCIAVQSYTNQPKRRDIMGNSKRGFASMDRERQREIASKGGRAAHQKGTAHQFTSEEARVAGRKGGEAVSRDRAHMSAIGREGGQSRGLRSRSQMDSPVTIDRTSTDRGTGDRNLDRGSQDRGLFDRGSMERSFESSRSDKEREGDRLFSSESRSERLRQER